MFSNLISVLRHNQSVVVSVVVCVLLIGWGYGCQPTTISPLDRSSTVTRDELDLQVKQYTDRVKLAYADLKEQEDIRKTVLEAGMAYAKTGEVNLFGLASTLAGIVGVGAIVDNRRKDAVIKSKDLKKGK
jgi:hypothetical protein